MATEKPRRSPSGVVSRAERFSSAAGVLAAAVLLLLVNVLSARHYRRVDVTSSKLYTLSPATLDTLRNLQQPIRVEMMLSPGDPLHGTLDAVLVEYRSHAPRIEIAQVDPDRHPAEFLAVQQKYGVLVGRTEDGRVVTDAALIVASGDKHWFVTSADLVDLSEAAEGRSRSKVEQALTHAIRSVIGSERMRLCATAGHAEFSFDDAGERGLSQLRERLAKNNYDLEVIDSTRPDAREPFKDCRLLVIAGPGLPFSQQEADEIAARMKAGMSGLFMLNPMFDRDGKKPQPTGLEPVAKLFGVGLSDDLVFERDDKARLPRGVGEVFFPELRTHAVTDGMVQAASSAGLRVLLIGTRSLHATLDGPRPAELLATSADSFGMRSFASWDRTSEPARRDDDRKGPLAVGMASELPASNAASGRGARLVVIGSANVAFNQNWLTPTLRGNSILVENAVSWLASRPPILDVPDRQTPAASLRITESSLGEIMRYVLVYMPGAAFLLGVSVFLMRRSDRKERKAPDGPRKQDRKASSRKKDPDADKPDAQAPDSSK